MFCVTVIVLALNMVGNILADDFFKIVFLFFLIEKETRFGISYKLSLSSSDVSLHFNLKHL